MPISSLIGRMSRKMTQSTPAAAAVTAACTENPTGCCNISDLDSDLVRVVGVIPNKDWLDKRGRSQMHLGGEATQGRRTQQPKRPIRIGCH